MEEFKLNEPKYTLKQTIQYLSIYGNGLEQNSYYYLNKLETENKKLKEAFSNYAFHDDDCAETIRILKEQIVQLKGCAKCRDFTEGEGCKVCIVKKESE